TCEGMSWRRGSGAPLQTASQLAVARTNRSRWRSATILLFPDRGRARRLSLTLRLLHGLPPEAAHRVTIAALRLGLAGAARAPPPPILQSPPWGCSFANPIGIAAGFDKHAEAIDPLLRLGFGCVEIGRVNPTAQGGNPPPRLVPPGGAP